MTVITYRSTDASAPVLTGSVGTLLTVLDAVLVNGYGALSAAGWAKPFSNSGNIGCYKNSAVDGTGFCLNVNDAGPGAGGAREARITGFQTMSALSTGTGQFPTQGQLAIGIGALVCRKSTTADTTARAWTIIADDTVFHLFIETGDTVSPTATYAVTFGDIFAAKTSDPYRCAILGRNFENTNAPNADPMAILLTPSIAWFSSTIAGHYMAAHWTGVGGSIAVGKHVDQTKQCALIGQATTGTSGATLGATLATNGSGIGRNNFSGLPYPNGPDGGLYLSPVWLHHTNCIRGYFKGLWAPLHDRPFNHNDTISGSGNLAGKSFLVQNIMLYAPGGGFDNGQILIETSNTWS
jgi:hypothetical protein